MRVALQLENLMNMINALRFYAGPQVPTEVHIEGDDGPLCLETLDHLNGGCSQLGAQRQCNAAGMETAGIAVDLVIIVINGQLVDGPCKVDDLLKAHATMEAGLIDEIGCFRKGGAGVVSGKTVIHYAPDAERVPFLVNDLFEWLRTTDEHPLIASCVFHYEFEFIHPFADGNGRTGRLWQTLILSRWRPIFKNLPIENIVYKYQKEYYKAIAVSGGKAGCTPFVEFILGVIAETLTTQEITRKTTQEIILEAIARNPSITRAELAEVVGISPDGVKYHLQKLAKSGRLKRVGSTRRGEWVIE